MEPGTGYLVMASHLPLQRITATVRFFRAVSAVRKQLATAEGLIGYLTCDTFGRPERVRLAELRVCGLR